MLERVVPSQGAVTVEVRAAIPEDHVILYALRFAECANQEYAGIRSEPLALRSVSESDGLVMANVLKFVGKAFAIVFRLLGAALSAGLAALGVGSFQQPNPGPPPSSTENREYRP
jgi:hypothetical protein